MTRGILTLLAVALIAVGVIPTIVRLHVDGILTLAILGLLIAVLAKLWPPATAQ